MHNEDVVIYKQWNITQLQKKKKKNNNASYSDIDEPRNCRTE